jgi:hypothetical protein
MKTSQTAVLAAAIFSTCFVTSSRCRADGTSLTKPVGTLSASSGLVRVGDFPTLKWNIIYPSTVKDHVDVDDNTVTPNKNLDVEVRVLGAGVTVSNSKGSNLTFVPTEALMSYAGGSYERIFFGTNDEVNPNEVVYSGKVKAGKPLRFGGRYYYNRKWGAYYNSESGTNNVRTLVNGDIPPTAYPLHTAPTLESFIKPYLDASGRVAIGPMDVIVFMELTHTDSQSKQTGYDLQDMVLLVTFKARK